MATRHPPVLGIDGAAKGWVGVVWDGDRATPHFAHELRELCETVGPVAAVAVDIPIELASDGTRPCDVAVRPLLGPRRSSLFAPPVRRALDLPDYATANAWSKANTGHGISKQAWMLVPKIREARALAASGSVVLHETFPELSFSAMNDDRPLTHPKRTWTGMMARLALLRAVGIEPPVDAGPAGSVAADDMIDAAALAWSARRIADGTARHAPAEVGPGRPSIWW